MSLGQKGFILRDQSTSQSLMKSNSCMLYNTQSFSRLPYVLYGAVAESTQVCDSLIAAEGIWRYEIEAFTMRFGLWFEILPAIWSIIISCSSIKPISVERRNYWLYKNSLGYRLNQGSQMLSLQIYFAVSQSYIWKTSCGKAAYGRIWCCILEVRQGAGPQRLSRMKHRSQGQEVTADQEEERQSEELSLSNKRLTRQL